MITGASAGIGRASALALANEGAYLVLTARRQHRLDELVETIAPAVAPDTLVAVECRTGFSPSGRAKARPTLIPVRTVEYGEVSITFFTR